MGKLQTWQIALLIIFYPIGIVYLIYRFFKKKTIVSLHSIKNHSTKINNSINGKMPIILNNSCESSDKEKKMIRDSLENCMKLGTDLIEASFHFSCSPTQAKYRGRVFSITGKDQRFPELTNDVLFCGLSFDPFIYGISSPIVSEMTGRKINIVTYSNRPFIDDRDKWEIDNYNIRLQEIEGEERKKQRKKEYYKLIDLLGEDFMPKSLAAYTKAKKAKTPKFIEIKKKAEKCGFNVIDEE